MNLNKQNKLNSNLNHYVIVIVHLSASSRLRGLKARAQREPVTS